MPSLAPKDPWLQNEAVILASREMRLRIDHAFHGHIPNFSGQNILPVSRLYFALEDCGYIRWRNGEKSLQLREGSITYMPPQVDLEFDFNGGDMVALHVAIEIFPGIDVYAEEKDCHQQIDRHSCQRFYKRMSESSSLAGVLSLQGDVLHTVAMFCQYDFTTLQRQVKLRNKYQTLLTYINDNLDARLTVGELVSHLNTTRDQLSKSFKRDMGISLKQFLSELLIRKISEGLLTGASVKEIAYQLNFSSEFYLSRFFRKHTGSTPTDFRNRYV